jgi:uncharacterized protein with LGFP repeats
MSGNIKKFENVLKEEKGELRPAPPGFAVYGEIWKKWNSLGGEKGFLGVPLNDETGTPDGIGRYNHFQGGSIYWTPKTGAYEVHGAIRDKWASLGWERSILGYPMSDEFQDGIFRRSNFQHGFIRWTKEHGVKVFKPTIID